MTYKTLGKVEREAINVIMKYIDPATFPGLTLEQRCALGRYAKPFGDTLGVASVWHEGSNAFFQALLLREITEQEANPQHDEDNFASRWVKRWSKNVAKETKPLPSPELTWLYSHCRALGMTCKSDSGKWEEDMALFVSNILQQNKEL